MIQSSPAPIEALDATPSYRVEPSKSGVPTVAVTTDDGKSIHLHSRYQPLDEARRMVDALPLKECIAFHVHGFGLGYHVEELFDRSSDEAILCVVENDLLLLRTAFEQRDFSNLIRSNRVMFFWQLDKAGMFSRLMPHSATVAMAFRAGGSRTSLQLAPSFIARCKPGVMNSRRSPRPTSRRWY